MRVSRRVLSLPGFVGVTVLLLAGCASSADDVRSHSFAVTVPVAELTLEDLPETTLRPISGYSYEPVSGQVIYPSAVPGPQFWEGGVVRSIVDSDGRRVGGVQLIRLRGEETVWGPARDLALRDALAAFVPEKEFASMHVVDQEVLTAANVLGRHRDIAGWFDGRDLVMIVGAEVFSGEDLAVSYLTGQRPRWV